MERYILYLVLILVAVLLLVVISLFRKMYRKINDFTVRLECSEQEMKDSIARIVEVSNQHQYEILTKIVNLQEKEESPVEISDDDLYDMAEEIILEAGKCSASLLQRRLRIGYSRAVSIIDLLEKNGIVGPADGAKPREVYDVE